MKNTIFRIFGLIVLLLLIFGGAYKIQSHGSENNSDSKEVQVSFIGTKEDADCILLHQGQNNILIDTGEEEDAKNIVTYLKKNNVSTIQYLIFTHYDSDHIGGAEEVINNFKVEKIIRPYYGKSNKKFTKLINIIDENKIFTIIPIKITDFSLGNINLSIYPPFKKQYKDDNNYSLAALASYGKINMLFTGDALKLRTDELMKIHWPEINIYKVPHHGRANKDSEAFLDMLKPDYAIVTSKDADSVIKDTCKKDNVKLLFSVPQTITFSTDGSKLFLDK